MQATDPSSFLQPTLFRPFPGLVAAQSTRHGGVSTGAMGSLNLGAYTEDEPDLVRENQARFARLLGFLPEQVASLRQVHGSEVCRVGSAGHREGYDAMICDQKGILLAITVADCCPILIHDPVKSVVAAAHAGWKGTRDQVVTATLQAMQDHFECRPEDCLAWIGVCIGKSEYEVDADVADHFPEAFKTWDGGRGKFLLDLKAANRDQLVQGGLPTGQIEVSPLSTAARPEDFFSHRASRGKAGRGWAVIGMIS